MRQRASSVPSPSSSCRRPSLPASRQPPSAAARARMGASSERSARTAPVGTPAPSRSASRSSPWSSTASRRRSPWTSAQWIRCSRGTAWSSPEGLRLRSCPERSTMQSPPLACLVRHRASASPSPRKDAASTAPRSPEDEKRAMRAWTSSAPTRPSGPATRASGATAAHCVGTLPACQRSRPERSVESISARSSGTQARERTPPTRSMRREGLLSACMRPLRGVLPQAVRTTRAARASGVRRSEAMERADPA